MSRYQNKLQNCNLRVLNKPSEIASKFKHVNKCTRYMQMLARSPELEVDLQ